jgi:hypothetical protein
MPQSGRVVTHTGVIFENTSNEIRISQNEWLNHCIAFIANLYISACGCAFSDAGAG